MRAAQILELGGAPRVADVPDPEPGERELVDVLAVALNPLDLAVAAGRFYGGHPPFPYVPGCEAVARTQDGTRVYAFGDGLGVARDGTLGERATIAAERLVPIEDDVDDATAVALGIAGIIGWSAVERGRVGPGDRVLVLGASGTSGLDRDPAREAARRRSHRRGGPRPRRGSSGHASSAPTRPSCSPATSAAAAAATARPSSSIRCGESPPPPRSRRRRRGRGSSTSASPPAPRRRSSPATVRGKELELLGLSNFARTNDELRDPPRRAARGRASRARCSVDFETFSLDEADEAWRRQGAGAKSVVALS